MRGKAVGLASKAEEANYLIKIIEIKGGSLIGIDYPLVLNATEAYNNLRISWSTKQNKAEL